MTTKRKTKAYLRVEWWPRRNPTLVGADDVRHQVPALKELQDLIERNDPSSANYRFSIEYDVELSCETCDHVVEPSEVGECEGCGKEICDYCFYELWEDDTKELCADCFAKDQEECLNH